MTTPFDREASPEEIARVLALLDRISSTFDARGLAVKLMAASDELVVSKSSRARDTGRMLRKALAMLNQDFRQEGDER